MNHSRSSEQPNKHSEWDFDANLSEKYYLRSIFLEYKLKIN